MKTKRTLIKELVKDCGDIVLSSECFPYYSLCYDGDEAVAISFKGKYGYEVKSLSEIPTRDINAIYEDLREDFFEE